MFPFHSIENPSAMLPTMLSAAVDEQTVTSPGYTNGRYPMNTDVAYVITAPNEFDVITVYVRRLQFS